MFFRPLTMAGVVILGAILNGAVFNQYPIFGLEPDMMMLIMIAMILIERTATPIIFTSVAALFMDIMYSPAIGYYALPYALVGIAAYFIFRRMTFGQFLVPPFAAAAGWLLKDILSAILAILLGAEIEFMSVFMNKTLPGIALNGILMLIVYWLLRLLYRAAYMQPPKRDESF